MLDPQLIQRPAELILKELRGEQTEAEARELQEWLSADPQHRDFYNRMTSAPGLQSRLKQFGSRMSRPPGNGSPKNTFPPRRTTKGRR